MSLSLDELQAAFQKLTASNTPPPASAGTPTPPAEGQPAAPATTPPPPTVQVVDPKAKGYHLDVTVVPEQVVAAAQIADRFGFGMDMVSGVDWMTAGQMEVVYDYFHPASVIHLVVRTRIPRDMPELPTIEGIFPGANWHERETHEMFGIKFLGHPNLTPLLLPEDADFHPLRKDFVS